MDWSLGNIVRIGLRIIAHREQIKAVFGRASGLWQQAQILFPEINDLIGKIAPELQFTMSAPLRSELPAHAYDVKWLQQSLNQLLPEMHKVGVDGRWGKHTENAVRQYQTSRGLEVDGFAGPLTLAMIEGELMGWPHRAGRYNESRRARGSG